MCTDTFIKTQNIWLKHEKLSYFFIHLWSKLPAQNYQLIIKSTLLHRDANPSHNEDTEDHSCLNIKCLSINIKPTATLVTTTKCTSQWLPQLLYCRNYFAPYWHDNITSCCRSVGCTSMMSVLPVHHVPKVLCCYRDWVAVEAFGDLLSC